MMVKLRKIGNSNYLLLPDSVMDLFNIKENDEFTLDIRQDNYTVFVIYEKLKRLEGVSA
jgi:antitoxin component of MazEF toxin-antitoxin module